MEAVSAHRSLTTLHAGFVKGKVGEVEEAGGRYDSDQERERIQIEGSEVVGNSAPKGDDSGKCECSIADRTKLRFAPCRDHMTDERNDCRDSKTATDGVQERPYRIGATTHRGGQPHWSCDHAPEQQICRQCKAGNYLRDEQAGSQL
jgi:hypothetical protein